MHNIIHYEGDIIDWLLHGRIQLLVHQCNCFHTMGAGIARILAARFPEVTQADRATPYGHQGKVGTASIAFPAQLKKTGAIGNIYSQFRYGKGCHTQYDAISKGILHAAHQCEQNGISHPHIGIPYRYGAGLGGGDWTQVKEALAEVHKYYPICIIVLPRFVPEAKASTEL